MLYVLLSLHKHSSPAPLSFSSSSSPIKSDQMGSNKSNNNIDNGAAASFREEAPPSLFLFLVMKSGELIGIDLSGSGEGEISHPPPYAPIRVSLDLQNYTKYNYPIGMRHFKLGGKHYLCGGALKPYYRYVGPADDFSDKVFHLHLDTNPTTVIKDPQALLNPIPTPRLLEPKFPRIVAHIKGSVYLLHGGFWFDSFPCMRHVPTPKVPFERLDLNENVYVDVDVDVDVPPFSCHQLPPPPWITTWSNMVPFDYPIHNHFVFDDKLVICCPSPNYILTFTPSDAPDDGAGGGKWSYHEYSPVYSFFQQLKLNGLSLPATGLYLPEFCVAGGGDDDGDSLGVLLAIDWVVCDDLADDDDVAAYMDSSFTIYAYAISKTTFQPKFMQILDDQVFFDILPDPHPGPTTNPLIGPTGSHHLLDLGKGDEEGARRICAILAADCFDRMPCLFVSIFDVRINNDNNAPAAAAADDDDDDDADSDFVTHNFNFLSVSPPIKKLAFRMDMERGFMFDSNPVLDAFFI
ncbi:hypothetical protein RIF29_28185 [Crotalaria pallida]|uniref:Uncharacterized protein n=1 Tax=Crotalaria pallida TaxID=3830 RepID=A0AAN9I147_CROPI